MSAIWWMLWAQLCVLLGLAEMVRSLLAKTHAKAAQTKVRADLLAPVAKTANTTATAVSPITSVSGQAAYLASLKQQSVPATMGSSGLSFIGPSGLTTVAQIQSWLNSGGFPNLMNNICTYIDGLNGVDVNIIDNLGDFNAW